MIEERNFKTTLFKFSLEKKTFNITLEIVHLVMSLQNTLIVLLETFLKGPVLERDDVNWVDVLPTETKHYNNRIHSSTELTPVQTSVKKHEGLANII